MFLKVKIIVCGLKVLFLFKMAFLTKQWFEGYIYALSEEKYAYSVIQKRCESHGFVISKASIGNIVNKKGKKRQIGASSGTKIPNKYPRKKRTSSTIAKVRCLMLKENPPSQRTVAKSLKCSVSTVNKMINVDLNLKKAKKRNVHRLLPKHIAERRTRCRILYEKHLSKEKWKTIVTIDESWVYLNDCNKKRAIYYHKRGEKNLSTWFKESKESFSKGFMIVAGFSYNGKLKIKRVEKNVKINSKYYQEHILSPIFLNEIPSLYPQCHQSVRLHQDKASSHTSKSTVNFLKEMEQKTGIKAVPFTDIPTKSPDVSPMDFCAFGLLKSALSKRRPKTLTGLWKAVQEEWDRIPLLTLQKALLSWKLRCRKIVQNKGCQIEHLKHKNFM